MEREELKSIVESLLFVADGPQTLQRLGEVIDSADKEELQGVLSELQAEHGKQNGAACAWSKWPGGINSGRRRPMPIG